MRNHIKIIVLLFIGTAFSFCASINEIQSEFPQEIETVYFQKWVGGVRGSGGGTVFHMKFKAPLSKEIQLEKIYFENQEANIEERIQGDYVASFIHRAKEQDLILEEDGNRISAIEKPKFDLKPNEAILEYRYKNKTMFFKMTKIKEIPMIAYPSMNKPKN